MCDTNKEYNQHHVYDIGGRKGGAMGCSSTSFQNTP